MRLWVNSVVLICNCRVKCAARREWPPGASDLRDYLRHLYEEDASEISDACRNELASIFDVNIEDIHISSDM